MTEIINLPAHELGKMAIAVPRHTLAKEIQGLNGEARLAAGVSKSPILHGRNSTNCARWPLVSKAQDRGFSPGALCKNGEQLCPEFLNCPYQINQRIVEKADNIIITHKHLTLPWLDSLALKYRKRMGIDEDPSNNFRLVETPITDEQLGDLVNDAEIAKLTGSISGIESLKRLSRDLLTGLSSTGGLQARHLIGWTSGKLRRASVARRKIEDYRRGRLNPALDDATLLAHIERAKTPPKKLAAMIFRLAKEIEAGREGAMYSLYRDPKTRQICMRGRIPTDTLPPNLLLADATAEPLILPGYAIELVEIVVPRRARITQIRDLVFSQNWLLPEGHLPEVIKWIEQLTSRYNNVVILTTQTLRRAITGEIGDLDEYCEFHSARIGHYGNIRGSDKYKECDALVLLGRQQPAAEEVEEVAKAFWYDTPKALKLAKAIKGAKFYQEAQRPYLMRDGSEVKGEVQVHLDRRCQAVLAGMRENELIQALDRARLIWGEPKDVFILCDIPLPGVEIDRLVSWDTLRGADRLSQAIKATAGAGKEALPLSSTWLTSEFKNLFPTEKSAARWLENSPEIKELRENPHRSNIKSYKTEGGSASQLIEYRLPRPQGGAGRWCTALVWGPSPRGAIAHALGVPEPAVELKRPPEDQPKQPRQPQGKSRPWVTPLSFITLLRSDEGAGVLLTR